MLITCDTLSLIIVIKQLRDRVNTKFTLLTKHLICKYIYIIVSQFEDLFDDKLYGLQINLNRICQYYFCWFGVFFNSRLASLLQ